MKPRAIVYTSNTGHTAAYAKLLGDRIGLTVLTLDEALANLNKGSGIIYLGWIMAGKVQGYKKAARRFNVGVVCGVGMVPGGLNADKLRAVTGIRSDIDVYAAPGGFEFAKLRGLYKMMMGKSVQKTAAELGAKPQRTPAEDELYKLMTDGASLVDEKWLDGIVEWYKKQK